jgi:hypothetical protein
LFLLILLAAGSACVGIRNALHQSQDFQWSGARLLDRHIDPWAVYLQGDPDHQLVGTQIPNYLPILYVFLAPFGLLPSAAANLAWALCNVGFAVGSAWAAARFYGLRGRGVVTLICLLLIATPTRTTIGNGQQSLFVLALWCLTLLASGLSDRRAAVAGISYAKFSFAPPMFLYLLFRLGLRKALLSLLPVAAGAGLAWWWLTGGHDLGTLRQIAGEPFAVAKTGFRPGVDDQNLMNIVQSILPGVSGQLGILVSLSLACSVCLVISFFAFRVRRDGSVPWQMAVMATMSFALFNHHSYDGVVLLLPLCYALRHWQERRAHWMLGLLGYLFYVQRVLEAAHLHPAWAKFVEFGMLMSLLALTYRMRETESALEATPESKPYAWPQEVAITG